MEQEFYRDEFEQMLKDTTEDFRMYPSRKVWHSIYNDLHPDRKWPSFAVCLILLTGILYVGVSNNNSINSGNRNNTLDFTSTNAESYQKQDVDKVQKQHINLIAKAEQSQTNKTDYSLSSFDLKDYPKLNYAINNLELKDEEKTISGNSSVIINEHSKTSVKITNAEAENNIDEFNSDADEIAVIDSDDSGNEQEKNRSNPVASFNPNQQINTTDNKDWIDDFAFYNKKKEKSAFKGGWHTQFYVAPSIGYRVLFRNEKYTAAGENALIADNIRANPIDKEPNEQGALSIEAGAGVIKEVSSRFRIKTGFQFNYSDFITNAQRLDHPTTTTVAISSFNGVVMENYSSLYANVPGKNNDQLHNRTLQLSVPIGFDYKVMGNKKVTWYAGASIQPTYIAGGYAWAQSADNNFYVEDASLLRRWNLNAGVESFVSFKAPSGASINIGPQFRYQLMSTYTKRYTYTEKPYNIGFKIGLSKPL